MMRADVGFVLPGRKHLHRAGRGLDVEETNRWFAFRVARQPHELRSHVQRILHLYDKGTPTQLAGALVDLYLVLGKRGCGLRRHMLERCSDRLDEIVAQWLQLKLDPGLDPHEPIPPRLGSVLAIGTSGNTCFSIADDGTGEARPSDVLNMDGNTVQDLLSQASDHILEGRTDSGRHLLSLGLKKWPSDPALFTALRKLEHFLDEADARASARRRS